MGRKRTHLGEAAWRGLLRRFDAGDETVDAFCQREGVSKSTFNRWRSRSAAAREGASATSATSVAKSNRTAAATKAGFVDLGALCRPAADAGRLEIALELGSGVTLHVVRG